MLRMLAESSRWSCSRRKAANAQLSQIRVHGGFGGPRGAVWSGGAMRAASALGPSASTPSAGAPQTHRGPVHCTSCCAPFCSLVSAAVRSPSAPHLLTARSSRPGAVPLSPLPLSPLSALLAVPLRDLTATCRSFTGAYTTALGCRVGALLRLSVVTYCCRRRRPSPVLANSRFEDRNVYCVIRLRLGGPMRPHARTCSRTFTLVVTTYHLPPYPAHCAPPAIPDAARHPLPGPH
jgi:hypothetical protein